jgi:hypothetical protein
VWSPLAAPAAVLAAGWLLLALGPGGSLPASLGRIWALSPIWTVPLLLAAAGPLPWKRLGAGAAFLVTPIVAWQLAFSPEEPSGLFSHHLTLAYALLPAFAAALSLRWWPAAALLAGSMLATGAAGAFGAIGTTAAVWAAGRAGTPAPRTSARTASRVVAGLAVAASIAGLAYPGWAEDVRRRAILWTGGLDLAGQGGVPPGAWRAAVAPVHRSIDPTFDFPHHAHDAAIQAAGDAGPAAWAALGWAGAVIVARAPAWAFAGAAGLAVAGLTQDWIGDLEVLRAAAVWAAIALAEEREP